MPSSIPGYEYDIFISYRQKDNSYDGWVTRFINNLRKELEATFKQEIFIYTDENKYDGIQEIHHVKESISSKLKCVIFIPIISQTYCDPNCYAWKNEFLEFKKIAKADELGLRITLPNGNVISRIVPIRIHEIDPLDEALLENEIEAPVRSIDFIFKSQGVNRPLRENEDHPADNQYKIYYRDQINKVANLIKEVVLSLKSNDPTANKIEQPKKVGLSDKGKKPIPKKIAIIAALILLIPIAYYFFGSSISTNPLDKRVAIAVLPFTSIGPEEEGQYFADGIMEVLLSNLTLFPELKVKPKASVEKYRGMTSSIAEIAADMQVDYILYGSAQKYGDDIRIVVQLVDAKKDVNIWSENFVKKLSNIFEVQNQISESVATYLQARLTADIEKQIQRNPTSNFEAYDLYLQARQLTRKYEGTFDPKDLDAAISKLEQSLRMDNRFALSYAWLSGLKAIQSANRIDSPQVRDSIIMLANKALNIDSTIVEANLVLSQFYNYELDDVNTLRYSYKALGSSTIDSLTAIDLVKRVAGVYSRIGDVDKAIYLYDQLYSLNPANVEALQLKFVPLAAGHYVSELEKLAKQIEHLNPNDIFHEVINAHVLAEKKDDKGLVGIYQNLKRSGQALTLDQLDQYVFILAKALKKNGSEQEAFALLTQLQQQIPLDDYYSRSQLSLLQGNRKEALEFMDSVSIGWYNVNLCKISPVFDEVADEGRFKNFIRRNTERINSHRIRVNELERNGYLPLPDAFFGVGKHANENWL